MDDNSIQSQGGKARAEKLSPEKRTEIAKKAASSRWVPQATHMGVLKIGEGIALPCAVLNNPERDRVISGRSLATVLDARGSGPYWKKRKEALSSAADSEEKSALLPEYLSGKHLEPFISDEIVARLSESITYKPVKGDTAIGIRAAVVPEICDIWIRAKEKSALAGKPLTPRQQATAEKAYLLLKAFANVGIVALIDEATGYQEVRNKEALQALLDAFLRQEFAAWAKRFPDEFYKEIFRLRGWPWDRLSVKRPVIVGKLTNDVVYERLAPGVLTELENKNPKDEKGRRKSTHHQWLTEDVGHPALAQHLHAVIGLMRASSSWKQFHDMLDRAFPKKGDVVQLELIEV